MTEPCPALKIPPEIFINICLDLPPADLLSLARVCKKFHAYLCSTNSTTTQEIWKNSRMQFMPQVQMPPPEQMDERQYVKLLFERGCQFCGKPRVRRVYWAFLARCCKSCLEERTMRLDQIRRDLLSQGSVPDDILCGLTHTTSYYKWGWDRSPKNRPANLYWIEDVHKAYLEYTKLSSEARKSWLAARRKEGHQKMEDVAKREIEHENAYWSKTEDNEKKREERASTIESLIKKEKNEYGFPRFKMAYVEQCMVYNKAMMSSSTHPFTERAWIGFRNKLIPQHDKIAATHKAQRQATERHFSYDVAVQTRQMDIVKTCFELLRPEIELRTMYPDGSNGNNNGTQTTTSGVSDANSNSTNDTNTTQSQSVFESGLIKFLPWCQSFRNPPFIDNDPTTLWDEDFLMGVLMPQLRTEAMHLRDNPAPSTEVRGAVLNSGLGNKRIFKCALCQHCHSELCEAQLQNSQDFEEGETKEQQLYSFFEIRLHLVKSEHNIRMINEDSMIIVVPEAFETAETAQSFPRNKPEIFFAVGFNCNLIVNL
ncbi:8404_t:CDS:2 [Acaulospora morrowiae]|uniref:8404_t:CDS:1 n=1 Tax=Acaulospora morrowiae TaxID=94023 RepID=A0A9N8VYW7_9GLOM|nr:8404_t:CDS:2 [Acaulospora morrowiae]